MTTEGCNNGVMWLWTNSTPGVEELVVEKSVNGAFDKSGRSLSYFMSIRGMPVTSDGMWDPVGAYAAGEPLSLMLYEWILETNKGKKDRGCQLCGDFNGQIIMTVIPREGPLAEGECL